MAVDGGSAAPLMHKPTPRHRHLGVYALAAVIFFTSTGGAYGTEDTIQAAGPLFALLGYLILPWMWSLPQALYTAELATLFPTDGGVAVWAKVAFNEYWGFQGGCWAWIEGSATLAAFPTLVVDYLQELLPPLGPAATWLLRALCALAFVGLNMRGVNWVGVSAISLGIFVLSPLIVMTIMGLPMTDVTKWVETRDTADLNLTYLLNLMLWNLSGYDNMGALSGEIMNPRYSIPRAQIIAVTAGSLGYLVPLAVAAGIKTNWADWHEGYLAVVAKEVGGTWLFVWIIVGAAAARMSNFMAELCTTSFFLQGMSEQGMLPSILSWRHPQFDTPWVSILFNFAVVLLLMMMKLPVILQLANLFTVLSFLLGLFSLLRIRVLRPVDTRDKEVYNVPLTPVNIVFFVAPALALTLLVLFMNLMWGSIWLIVGVFVATQVGYIGVILLRHYSILDFVEPPPIGEIWYTF